MLELFHSPQTIGSIPSSHVSSLFHPDSNRSISSRQACAVGLRNVASRRVIRDGLTLPFTLKLARLTPRCPLNFYGGLIDSRST